MRIRAALLSSTIMAGALAAAPALAADPYVPEPVAVVPDPQLPAVSGPNGKLSLLGGGFEFDDEDGAFYGAAGAFSVPLGQALGLQVDGMLTSSDDDLAGGVAGHLFWRDPTKALVGLYGSWTSVGGSDVDAYRFGVESEVYLGPISLEGMIGWESLDFDDFDDEDNLFALADIAFYPTDDLRLSVGYRRWDDRDIAAVGAEYQLPANWGGTSAALFAEGRIGEDDYKAVWGGLRFYFGGESKSLIRRHREDDPRKRLEEDLAGSPRSAPSVEKCDGLIVEGECWPFT